MDVIITWPTWPLIAVLLGLMLAANEAGFRMGRALQPDEPEPSRAVSTALKASIFGLVAFLPTSRSSCTGRRGPCMVCITSSRSGPTSTTGSSTTVGTRIAGASTSGNSRGASFRIEQHAAKSANPLPAGKHTIKVVTDIKGPGQPGTVTLTVDGEHVASTNLKRSVPLAFTASETFDVGVDLGSPVSLNYFDRRPFEFNGTINQVTVELK